ncbi:MAG: CaiB/BaiF CoA-transferase family protein [Bacillota bacterium]
MAALDGIKVLDLSRVLAGPYCSMLLADMGAEVVKVEMPGTGDDTRAWGPPFQGGEAAYYLSVNRNKKSVTVNMKHPEGLGVIRRLASSSDILLENFRPGTMDRLGLEYDEVKAYNPGIIYCSISGFGQDGPYRDKPAYDLLLQATGGLMGITGEEDGSPVRVGVAILDMGAGMFAALGIITALLERQRSGEGQRLDFCLLDTSVSWLSYMAQNYFATGQDPRRLGSAHPSIVPYQAFPARDGHVVVAVGNDRIWERFCQALGLDIAHDPRFETNSARVRNREELVDIISRVLSQGGTGEWVKTLEASGVPCGPINLMSDIFRDPQVAHRRMTVEVRHPSGPLTVLGSPMKMSRTPGEVRTPPPLLGEHTNEVLTALGYTEKEILALREKGAI